MISVVIAVSILLGGKASPVERYNLAVQHIKGGDYRSAIKELKKLTREMPDFAREFEYRIGECYFNSGDPVKALEIFENLLRKSRGTYLETEVLYMLGLSALMAGDTARARHSFERLESLVTWGGAERARLGFALLYYKTGKYRAVFSRTENEEDPIALYLRGRALLKLNRPREALPLFEKVLRESPDTSLRGLSLFSQGQALLLNGDMDAAYDRFETYLKDYEGELKPYAQFLAGFCLLRDKRYNEALSLFRASSESGDKALAAASYYYMGECELELGNSEGAIRFFRKVADTYGRSGFYPFSLMRSAEALAEKGNVEEAMKIASRLSGEEGNYGLEGMGDYLTGALYYASGEFKEAASYFEKVLQASRDGELLGLSFAMLLNSLDRADEYDRAIAAGAGFLAEHEEIESPYFPRALYYLAEAYYYHGDFPEAEKLYHRVLLDYPGDEIASFAEIGYGFTLAHVGRYEEAEKSFRHVLELFPDDSIRTPLARFGLGVVYFNLRDYEKALSFFESLHRDYPERADLASKSLYYAGLSYYQLEYYLQAIESWEKLLEEYPESEKVPMAALKAGDTYYKAGKYDRAIALFRWLTQHYPDNEVSRTAQLLMAQAYYNMKDFDRAIEEFTKFLQLYPDDKRKGSAREGLAMCLYMKGESDTSALRALAENFKDLEIAAEAQFKLARNLMDDEKYREAAREFEKVVMRFPDSDLAPKAQLLYSECYALLGEWDKSEKGYRKFLEYFPGSDDEPLALFNLGVAQYNQNKLEEAARTFEELQERFPDGKYAEKSRKYLSLVYKRLGKREKAVEVLGSSSGGGFEMKAEAARMLIEGGDYDKAIDMLLINPPRGKVEKLKYYYLLGKAYREKGDIVKAKEYYSRARRYRSQDPDWLRAMADLGAIYEKEGAYSDALSVYREMLELVSDEGVRKALEDKIAYLKSIQGGK
ncbi:MAG: tetratricopeptide repeat protein [Candidatus Hydrothermae bacterium]|nr:tetratricopeptide repeat protein [Candidatus Hydrothermae bacterium]